jgi:hypothetical protein
MDANIPLRNDFEKKEQFFVVIRAAAFFCPPKMPANAFSNFYVVRKFALIVLPKMPANTFSNVSQITFPNRRFLLHGSCLPKWLYRSTIRPFKRLAVSQNSSHPMESYL